MPTEQEIEAAKQAGTMEANRAWNLSTIENFGYVCPEYSQDPELNMIYSLAHEQEQIRLWERDDPHSPVLKLIKEGRV